jgi:hypothetical protein
MSALPSSPTSSTCGVARWLAGSLRGNSSTGSPALCPVPSRRRRLRLGLHSAPSPSGSRSEEPSAERAFHEPRHVDMDVQGGPGESVASRRNTDRFEIECGRVLESRNHVAWNGHSAAATEDQRDGVVVAVISRAGDGRGISQARVATCPSCRGARPVSCAHPYPWPWTTSGRGLQAFLSAMPERWRLRRGATAPYPRGSFRRRDGGDALNEASR